MENIKKGFCYSCNEDTPHHEEPAGLRCEVCFTFADAQQWFFEVEDSWIANFWRAKYFGHGQKGVFLHAGNPSTILAFGKVPQDHVTVAVVDIPPHFTAPVKIDASILPEPKTVEITPKYFPPSKSKYHK